MARKKRTTATRSHLHGESPSPDASLNTDPNLAGKSESQRRRQGKKQKGQSSCSEIELGASSAERGGGDNPKSLTTTRPGHLENERRAKRKRRKSSPLAKQRISLEGKGLQADAPEGSGSPPNWLWVLTRKCLWNPFGQNFRGRRQSSSRATLRKRGNKTAKKMRTADSNCLENDGHNSSSKRNEMDKTTELRISSVLEDIITAENENFIDYHKPEVTLPSWRPSISIKNDVWVPRRVETNGEGRKRLQWNWGDPLVEVFDIKVDLRGMTKTHGNIHGKITLDCYGYAVDLFNCNQESSVMIKDKGSLPLKSPDIALLGYEPIGFIVSLEIDDDKLCDGLVLWCPTRDCSNEWLFDTVEGENGNVHVTYMVMKHSWLAELGVKLIKSTKETSSKIHGDIVVYINDIPYLTFFSFSKQNDDYSVVNPLEPIPLSRSLFACHRGSSLVVNVDLWDYETSKPLARGALSFSPEYYGEYVGTVPDPCGIVQVTVNWQHYLTHSKTLQAVE